MQNDMHKKSHGICGLLSTISDKKKIKWNQYVKMLITGGCGWTVYEHLLLYSCNYLLGLVNLSKQYIGNTYLEKIKKDPNERKDISCR